MEAVYGFGAKYTPRHIREDCCYVLATIAVYSTELDVDQMKDVLLKLYEELMKLSPLSDMTMSTREFLAQCSQ